MKVYSYTVIFEPVEEGGYDVIVPVEWFPRLCNASDEQRKKWRLIGKGVGIHWEDIDEDIAVASLLLG